MTAKVEKIISDIDSLSKEDFKLVQDHMSEKMEEDRPAVGETLEDDEKMKSLLKVGYRISSQDLKKLLSSFLSPEELVNLDDNELDDFPTLPKTITEYINEDREDRL